jgi:hypothetical protein
MPVNLSPTETFEPRTQFQRHLLSLIRQSENLRRKFAEGEPVTANDYRAYVFSLEEAERMIRSNLHYAREVLALRYREGGAQTPLPEAVAKAAPAPSMLSGLIRAAERTPPVAREYNGGSRGDGYDAAAYRIPERVRTYAPGGVEYLVVYRHVSGRHEEVYRWADTLDEARRRVRESVSSGGTFTDSD